MDGKQDMEWGYRIWKGCEPYDVQSAECTIRSSMHKASCRGGRWVGTEGPNSKSILNLPVGCILCHQADGSPKHSSLDTSAHSLPTRAIISMDEEYICMVSETCT